MNSTIVTVGTITYALKAKKLLSRAGIRSKLVKVESGATQNGCTHGIEISAKDFYHAVLVLKENGINYSVYSGRRL